MVVNTAQGMVAIGRDTSKVARSLRLRPGQHAEPVLISAMPDILIGLRYALGAALVASENTDRRKET